MNQSKKKITVYYDGACPSCIKDRENYEKLAGKSGRDVCWFDISGQNTHLRDIGIDPHEALSELHVRDEHEQIVSELDAYILLMSRITLLKPLAWLIGLPVIRPLLSSLYHRMVNRRLKKSGRLKEVTFAFTQRYFANLLAACQSAFKSYRETSSKNTMRSAALMAARSNFSSAPGVATI